ncbi:hypothetical protein [Klebsiella pneumoniae]|uniref:hypothetical protein n=1 Tax=Klebsiella pneumoniae TaxID=573 RepID=UPI001FAC4832|nr:hypothetical protein [Klebsiella pneumoniae]MCI8025626.1 hypothetical protein [Klebsiella pneumoniae]MDX6872427.1 hypothetical protein [Klebsiella pneumoniae]HBZ7538244.1 hypothetical protein [Klebsiella pneumoniae]
MTDREIALEQALIAVIGAYRNDGGDVDSLIQQSQGLLLGNTEYRFVEHPYITEACTEIEKAASFKK